MNLAHRTQRGFTLLELLVAVGVFAVMSVMAYGGLKTVLSARQQTDAQAKRLAAVELTFMRLERDIEEMTDRRIRDEFGDAKAALLAETGDDTVIEFTHAGWSNPTNAPRSHLQRVGYTLKDNQLLRAYWLVLDRAQDSKPVQTVMLDKVKSMEWRFMDNTGAWQTQWPPPATTTAPTPTSPAPIQPLTQLPRAVEVTLELDDLGQLTRLFSVPGEHLPVTTPAGPGTPLGGQPVTP
jgi:general secretion pathway protein J